MRHAIVVGGGLAGASAAASLAIRGWKVDLIERHSQLAAEASGNAQGILYARLSGNATPLRELVIAGYCYSNRLLRSLQLADYAQCGLLQLGFDDAEAQRQAQLLEQNFPPSFLRAVDRAEASALSGVSVPHGGLWFAQGGWANPPAFCSALAAHANIRLHLHSEALRVERDGEQWRAMQGGQCIASAPVVVLAGGKDLAAFSQSAHLPFTTIRGQTTALPPTAASAALKTVVCGERYIAPVRDGLHTLGATHKFRDLSTEIRPEEHEENLQALAKLMPDLSAEGDPSALQGRAAIRISTPDYLPLIGPLVDAAAFRDAYAPLSRDATTPIATPAPWLDGLYVSAAHGSRGLISAPLAGELLAAYLNEEPSPLAKAVGDAVHPSRFLLRDLIRRGTEKQRGE